MKAVTNDHKYYLYLGISLLISLVVGFFVRNNKLITGIPFWYVGNFDAVGGINSSFSLFSRINLGESRIQNSWVIVISFLYRFIRTLLVDPFLFRGLFTSFSLFSGFYFIEKISKLFFSKTYLEIFLIASGFLFSTFLIIFFEDYSPFAYLYWLLPMKLFTTLSGLKKKKNSAGLLLLGHMYTLFASMINLPFALLAEAITILSLLINKNITKKYLLRYILSAIGIIFVAILPSLIYTLLDPSFSDYVLSSETFYRNNTTISTFVSGITDWGFFGSNDGIPYRSYAHRYRNSFMGFFTYFWLLIPLLVLVQNPKKIQSNTIYFLGLLLISMLIVGPLNPISGLVYDFFFSLPMSDIFRNNVKFFFAIYAIILMMLLTNSKKLLASILFFLSSLLTLLIFISGGNYTNNKIKHKIDSTYSDIHDTNVITENDRILLFPQQYIPIYIDENESKTSFGYSRPELFWNADIILNRCEGCGNPLFEKDRDKLLNLFSKDWKKYLELYGVTKIIYDMDVDMNYYPNTLTHDQFHGLMIYYGFPHYKKINNIIIYSTGIANIDNLTICDSGRYRKDTSGIHRTCNKGDIRFIVSKEDFYLPNYLALLQIPLVIIIFFFSLYGYHIICKK